MTITQEADRLKLGDSATVTIGASIKPALIAEGAFLIQA